MGLHGIYQHLPVTHQFLGSRRVIPQVGVFDPCIKFFKSVLRCFDIKTLRQQRNGFLDICHDVLYFCAHALPAFESCRLG